MEYLSLWAMVGFLLAAYSVVANDSVQTLGTWIASNHHRFRWQTMWFAASSVLLWAIWYGWFMYDGDISYDRLARIPYVEVQWYHALAPGLLLILTRFGVPVSTSFLVLSAFASTFVLEKMLIKSVMGYAVAAGVAYGLWFGITKYFSRVTPESHHNGWVIAQWITTGLLWWTWLSHDIANIAVFLPRQVDVPTMIMISVIFVGGLAYMFREGGGRIQKIVKEKHNTKYIKSATMIDLVYWLILLVFKEINNIPMSTTWVFCGLLAGRELAIASVMSNHKIKSVFPLVTKDFMKLCLGVFVSTGIILFIHYVAIPQGW